MCSGWCNDWVIYYLCFIPIEITYFRIVGKRPINFLCWSFHLSVRTQHYKAKDHSEFNEILHGRFSIKMKKFQVLLSSDSTKDPFTYRSLGLFGGREHSHLCSANGHRVDTLLRLWAVPITFQPISKLQNKIKYRMTKIKIFSSS